MINVKKDNIKVNDTLLVYTSPRCGVCRDLLESGMCEKLQINKKIVLVERNAADAFLNKMIFKTANPHETFKNLVKGINIYDKDIDFEKNVDKEVIENKEMFQFLEELTPEGTPTFFIQDENGDISFATDEQLNGLMSD